MRRTGSAALAVGIAVGTLAGCSNHNDNPDPAPVPAPHVSLDLESGYQWDSENCLDSYIANDGTIFSVQKTNLCRAEDPDITTGTYYDLFMRGTSAQNTIETIGTQTDGYTYWKYSDGQWYRRPTNGGDIDLEVRYANGSLGYENLDKFEKENLSSGFKLELTAGIAESAIQRDKSQVASAITNPDTSSSDTNVTSTELQQANARLQQLTQQNQQLSQKLSSVQQQESSQSTAAQQQAQEMIDNARSKMLEIETQPACRYSDNGC